MKLGEPLAIREKEIAALKAVEPPRTKDVRFQGKLRTFPICTVRVEMPKYRLENGRTSAAQRDYIAKHKLPADFFDPARSENDEVQLAQHEILKTMAKSSDPDKDLFNFFKNRDQEDALILDHRGFVVNGNRRLCTYREINDVETSRFTHVDVIVLPDCDPKDIDELEVHLQVERDIKQEYTWISLAYALQQKLNSGRYNEAQLTQIFDLTPKELKQSLNRLTLADDYLASRGKPGEYLEVEKAQFAFEQLQKSRPKLDKSPGKQKLFSEIAYRLIDTREGDRVYASIPEALEVVDDIKNDLNRDALGSAIGEEIKKLKEKKQDDVFGPVTDAETEYVATWRAVQSAKDDSAIHKVIQNAIEAKRERDRAKKRGNSALDAIRRANTSLSDAVTLLSDQATIEGIQEQLESINGSMDKIRQWLNQRKTQSEKT